MSADRLAKIERKIDVAARKLNPIMARGERLLPVDVDRAVHDALNALASAMLEVGLLQMYNEENMNTKTEGANR